MALTCETPVNIKERTAPLAPSCRPSKRPCTIDRKPSTKNLTIPSLNHLDSSDVDDEKLPLFLSSFRPRTESPTPLLCSGFLPIIPQDEQKHCSSNRHNGTNKKIPSADAFLSSILSKDKEDYEPQEEGTSTKKQASSAIFVVPLPRRVERRPSTDHALCA